MRFLIAESEPRAARAKRRSSVGRSSGETYADVLRQIAPGAACEFARPTDGGDSPDATVLAGYDAVFLSGSPLHLYDASDAADRLLAFMRAVFASGTPSFGSCAGLQVATVAAGGRVRKAAAGHEALARASSSASLRLVEGAGHELAYLAAAQAHIRNWIAAKVARR